MKIQGKFRVFLLLFKILKFLNVLGKCFSPHNETSCNEFDSCSTCLDPENCLWCESAKSCLPVNTYIVNFPYGQCKEYVQSRSACSGVVLLSLSKPGQRLFKIKVK